MAALMRNFNQVAVRGCLFYRGSWLHTGSTSRQGLPLPDNVQEISEANKVGFSANRHKDMSHGVNQGQPSSMFAGSFMSDQSSQGSIQDPMVENYNSLAAMTLNAVTQTNVPDPFSPAVDTVDTPRLNMPEGSECHENKFTASDLQETLHPMGTGIGEMSRKGNWHGLHSACMPNKPYPSVRFYSTSPTDAPDSTKAKLKRAVKDYGMTVVVFHVTISIVSLGLCYTAVSSGLDVPGILESIGFTSEMLNSRLAAGASTFLVSYAVHKMFMPVRLSITLGSVPFIVRYLRRIGFLKTTPSS